MAVLSRQQLCYGQHIFIIMQNNGLLLILVECTSIPIWWGWPHTMLIMEKIESFVIVWTIVCNLNSCHIMDNNACNLVIDVSFNGRSYNYFFYLFTSFSNIQIREKVALPNIKGRNIYGVYGLRGLGFTYFRVQGLWCSC